MCLVMILGFLLMLALVAFAKSAAVLLPWTISAAVLAALSGMGFARLVGGSKARGAAVGGLSCFVLTFALGCLGFWLIPPKAPPALKRGEEQLFSLPEPTKEDLKSFLPIHLAIVGVISTTIVGVSEYKRSR